MRSTVPSLVCHSLWHIFYSEELRDVHYISQSDSYQYCLTTPCPHRYNGTIVQGRHYPSGGTRPDQSQEPLIRTHQQASLTSPSESTLPPAETSSDTQEDENSDADPDESSEDNRTELPPDPPTSPDPSDPGDNISSPTPRRAMSTSDILKVFADVPKLGSDGRNFQVWLQRVTLAAMGAGYDSYLNSESPTDADSAISNALTAAICAKLPVSCQKV